MSDVHNYSTYSNRKCRCQVCKTAWAAYITKRKAERRALVAASGLPSSVEHGESAYGNWGCRCGVCTEAWTVATRLRKARAAS